MFQKQKEFPSIRHDTVRHQQERIKTLLIGPGT